MIRFYLSAIALLMLVFTALNAQEDPFDDILNEKVVNENPVYKPLVGIGSGVFNFYGDVRNNYSNMVLGNYGYKVNFATYLDTRRILRFNLFFLFGKTSGNQWSVNDPTQNLNFQTDLVDFGFSLEYSFIHLIKESFPIRPYISAGLENIQFTPKGDIFNADGAMYYYWLDGTIRDIPETMGDIMVSTIIHRDFNYETDLRQRERELYNLGTYTKSAISFPVDIGLKFRVSDRVSVKLGSSIHFTLSDYIDNVAEAGTSIKGKKGNDIILYNYFALDFDLFSEPKTMIIERMFAEMEFDEVMFDDEDGDFILDAVDECPGTPYGVTVDSLGCPVDKDMDGVPDYLDKENDTAPGAWVDNEGKTVTEEIFLEKLRLRDEAMTREYVKAYLEVIGKGYVRERITEIPAKFIILDTDKDEYISFDELLQTIDDYFDQKLNLTVEDIYELINVFFGQ